MGLERALEFLDGATVGLFGVGHLGRAMASALLSAGLPRQQLLLCHSGSAATAAALAAQGFADRAVTPQDLLGRSKMVFYLVRPQAVAAIAGLRPRSDSLFVSFLAGTGLQRIPVDLPERQRIRVMISAPDTLAKRNGIAAIYPGSHTAFRSLLEALGLQVLALPDEDHMHAFTSLAPCLSIAAAYLFGAGQTIDRRGLMCLGERHGLSDYGTIIDWAMEAAPTGLGREDLAAYLKQAATPGGVTEAVLNGLRQDRLDLPAALERGIQRSRELAGV